MCLDRALSLGNDGSYARQSVDATTREHQSEEYVVAQAEANNAAQQKHGNAAHHNRRSLPIDHEPKTTASSLQPTALPRYLS